MALLGFVNAPFPSDPTLGWSTLAALINASQTTLTVVSFLPYHQTREFVIQIDDELLRVTGGGGTVTWTVTRGYEGTTAAIHAAGASVTAPYSVAGVTENPRSMTTTGDTEYQNASGVPTRRAIGTAGQIYTVVGGVPAWADLPDLSATYLTPAAAAAAYQPLGSYAAASHTHTASQVTDLATAAVAFTNKTGAISQWTNDSGYLTAASALAGSSDTQVLFNNAGVIGGFGSWNGSVLDINGRYSAIFTLTSNDATIYGEGLDLNITFAPTISGLNRVVTQMLGHSAEASSQDFVSILGGSYAAYHGGTGTVDHVVGFSTYADVYSATGTPGAVDDVAGLTTAAYNSTGASVGELRGVWVSLVGNYSAGTVSTGYGIDIDRPANAGGGTFSLYRHINLADIAGWGGSSAQAINYANKFVVDIDGKLTVPAAGLTIGANLVTLAGAFTTSGANALTLTTTGATNVTLPTSGTLLTSADLATYVVGPASSVDNSIARFDSTTGKLLQGYTSGAPTIGDTGQILAVASAGGVPPYAFASATTSGWDYYGGGLSGWVGGTEKIRITPGNEFYIFSSFLVLLDTTELRWISGDLRLFRDAAGTSAQRNGTNAQKARIYNTFTTLTTAGEWWKEDWQTTANQFRFGTVRGTSSGTARVASWDYGGLEASPTAAITVPITSGAITFGGPGYFPATSTALASVNLPHGTAPSAPVDGDIWTTTAGLYVRINGATVGPLS